VATLGLNFWTSGLSHLFYLLDTFLRGQHVESWVKNSVFWISCCRTSSPFWKRFCVASAWTWIKESR